LLRVVVDTNIFVSGTIIKRGNPHELMGRWRAGEFRLLYEREQYGELSDVLNRPWVRRRGIEAAEVADLLAILLTNGEPIDPGEVPLPVRDVDDEPILASALGGEADYLVTGDADLLVLDGDPRLGKLRIVTARAFLDLLREDDANVDRA
jgi:putative PIN family toxin of toxin-antitoxin system